MTPTQRVQHVLGGHAPDRTPVSFWHHFPPEQVCGPPAVEAHLNHLRRYELDFLKVMNDNGYPFAGRVESPADLRRIDDQPPDAGPFARQLELIAALRAGLGDDLPMTTTVFGPWATLRRLIRPPSGHGPPNLDTAEDEPSRRIFELYQQDAGLVREALMQIARNLAGFAEACIEAGADGIYLSVRDDWIEHLWPDRGMYERLVEPADRVVLAGAARGWFNLLHVCGRPRRLRRFAKYPHVQVINWADRYAGPAISEVRGWMKPAICGGVDNLRTLPEGTPEECQQQVRDALEQAAGRPILIAPGCTYDPQRVPAENLHAVVRAAHGA